MRHNLKELFPSYKRQIKPKILKVAARIIIFSFVAIILILTFVPWWQNSKGSGQIIAYDPSDRVQNITALVDGRIDKWYAFDGQFVEKGQKILDIVDNDPDIITKINNEKNAIEHQLEVSKIASETAKINYHRQETLYNEGISSRKDFEKAKIEYKKLLAYQSEIEAKLIQTDIKLNRQKSQSIIAPKDGFILNSIATSNSTFVKAGDVLATFVPMITTPAVELFVIGNDIPLIYPGRKVRIQFDGWPALQFGGWPYNGVGTFGGIVKVVDKSISANGKFRVIIVPDPEEKPWPDMHYLRQGTKALGWIILNKVKLGYEVWRQINGLPVLPDENFYKNQPQKK